MARGRGNLPLVANALPQRLRQRMAELSFSFSKADDACSLPRGTMSSIIYGKSQRPQPDTLQAIARGFGISYRELALLAYGIIGENEPEPEEAEVTIQV